MANRHIAPIENKIGRRLASALKHHRSNGIEIYIRESPEVNGKERVQVIVRNKGNEIRTVDRLDACPKVVDAAVDLVN